MIFVESDLCQDVRPQLPFATAARLAWTSIQADALVARVAPGDPA